MSAARRPFRHLWVVGLVVLLASAIGAGVALNSSRAGNQGGADRDAPAPGPEVICLGHADVEPGVTPLYPTQPGRVVAVPAEENKTYRKGALLLRVDRALAQAKLAEAEADLASAREKLAQAKKLPRQVQRDKLGEQESAVKAAEEQLAAARADRDYKRYQQKNGNINQNLVDAAEATYRMARAKLDAERAKREEIRHQDVESPARLATQLVAAKEAVARQARLAVDNCDVRAPADGEVLRVLTGPGEVLGPQPKQPAILFCPTVNPPIVRAEVQQEYAAHVAVGKPAVIEDDTRSGPRWHGKVVRLSDWYTNRRSVLLEPLQYNDVRTMEAIVALDPGQPKLRIGQRVRVIIGGGPDKVTR